MNSQRTIKVELRFSGSGAVVKRGDKLTGGVRPPKLADLQFSLLPSAVDESGLSNPRSADSLHGEFQVDLWGSADAYRELGRYLLGVAELDTKVDPGFHEHHDLTSFDGRTKVHLIVTKPRLGE